MKVHSVLVCNPEQHKFYVKQEWTKSKRKHQIKVRKGSYLEGHEILNGWIQIQWRGTHHIIIHYFIGVCALIRQR